MAADNPASSYLVAALASEGTEARRATSALGTFIHRLEPKGAFSVTVNRQHGYAILCGFEFEEDADRMAAIVRAKAIKRYGGWLGQRAFKLDGRAGKLIAAFLSAPPGGATDG